jgi:arylsulfatase A-like enzyme
VHRVHRPLAGLLVSLGVVLALAAARPSGAGEPAPAGGPGTDRLNVVLIVTDDERADVDRVPSVRRLLAAQGITFTNAFTTTPECCPARAGILTGQYAHTNGVVQNSGPTSYPKFDESSSLAVWLHDAGYETALVGKYFNGYAYYGDHRIPPGWSEWHAIDSIPFQRYYDYVLNENGREVAYGGFPSDYSTSVLTGRAVDFLERAREPFFLYFAPLAPHLPATPPPGHGRPAPVPPLEPRPSFNERYLGDKPWSSWHPRPLRPGAVSFLERSIRDQQLQALGALDRSVAEIVAVLRRRGVLDRTVILYVSDNGFLWGEHRLGGKVWPYEESIRVPLVVRTPWEETWGRTDDRLVLNIDLAPTVAELAHVGPRLPQDGRSLVPLLRGDDQRWRTGFVVEYLGRDLLSRSGPPPYRGIRTKRYLYVEYENGWRELYDLARDPWEVRNVARDPAYARRRSSLAQRLEVLFRHPPRAGP